jgi:glycyl-tRNA synthetase (class II)
MVDDKKTGERFRADKLIEEKIESLIVDKMKDKTVFETRSRQ